MIQQTLVEAEAGPSVLTTFVLPSAIWADAIYLVGDFNEWNETSHRFRQDRGGRWVISVSLQPDRAYAFAYIRDGTWITDHHADGYVTGVHGRSLFLLFTDLERLRSQAPSRATTPMQLLPAG